MLKTIITAGGKGTRLLPATKETPKEMLPLFSINKKHKIILIPTIQLIFEQLYAAKLRDFCIVVGRKKRPIIDHFKPDYTYLNKLLSNNENLSEFYKKIKNSHFVWKNQKRPLGFGDAVRTAENYIGNENFLVHAADVVIIGKSKHPVLRLMEAAKSNSSVSAVLLCKKVKDAKKYGVPKIKRMQLFFEVEEVEEKPLKPKSNFALMPIYFFTPKIFRGLRKIKRGKNNEFQLTDAIQWMIDEGEKVIAIPLKKNEYELDVGTIESYRYSQTISYNNTKVHSF